MTGEAQDPEAPPVGEEIHLPGSSVVPLLNALGLAMAFVGLTFHWVLIVAGLALFVVTTIRWIRDSARDVAALPAEHSKH